LEQVLVVADLALQKAELPQVLVLLILVAEAEAEAEETQ
jgi:hypothetical protein